MTKEEKTNEILKTALKLLKFNNLAIYGGLDNPFSTIKVIVRNAKYAAKIKKLNQIKCLK